MLGRCNLPTLTKEIPIQTAGPDPSWKGLYRAGGIAAIFFAILSIGDAALILVLPPMPASTGFATLEYIASNRYGYILSQTLILGPVVLTLITFPALYLSLKCLSKIPAAIGSVLGIASVVLCLVPFSSVSGLVYLSYRYAAATTSEQQTLFASAAEALLAQNNSVNVGGILFAVSVLIISMAMLKGVFPKTVAWLGIVSGGIGIVCESLRPVIGAAFTLYGVVIIWLIAVGWKLFRLV